MDSDTYMLYNENSSGEETDIDYIESLCKDLETKKDDETDNYQFEVLSPEEIVQYMTDNLKDVKSVLGMPTTVTRILLNHFKWDKQKLLDKFYDGNGDNLFEEIRIAKPLEKENLEEKSISSESESDSESLYLKDLMQDNSEEVHEDCQICCISTPRNKLTGLECGHRFCIGCWTDYLKTKILEEGNVQILKCPAHNCNTVIDDSIVKKLLRDPKAMEKYHHLITNNFVDCNKLMKWCINPSCNSVIQVQYVDAKPIICKCYWTFCFECEQGWHEPISCNLLRDWMKKCTSDSDTYDWIGENTKECPKCTANIEKNGGCNHMTCCQCSHSFCWQCFEPWDNHGFDVGCNKFLKPKVKNKSKKNIINERYEFYNKRFMNHVASHKLESELYKTVQKIRENVSLHRMSFPETEFLKEGVDILVSCRRTLMCTYALGFYLDKHNQTVIFETNQRDLEHAVELLSGYFERDLQKVKLADIKLKIIDKSVYCDKRRLTLVKHVKEGCEQGWWKEITTFFT